MIIFRDDDVSNKTDLKRFKKIHALFVKYNVLHTIAVICKDLEKNKALVKYIQEQDISVQVHAWEHYDFTQCPVQLSFDLPKCVELITRLFHKPTTLYPPWNKSNYTVNRLARENGLMLSCDKISLSQYLRGVKGDVINFHSWSPECNDLEAALIKYTS